ncbi:ABC transporter ATP-binding protein [Flocculibacter collagenilyticus]|uniref:ABC transporter ATP-binding protein n=1 Tax=Flocculibacter collagenilyticus TaxID=2744479 RepID=UPI0018F4C925|nr:ABC transporter ATP-binding protein [Flocculibacter collagenilyticus]
MNTISSANSSCAILSVDQLCWFAGKKQVLNGITFTIATGSFTGLVGPNGAGKSSLLRCLYRFHQPASGDISFNNKSLSHWSATDYAKQVAVVLQETPSQFNLTVFDVVGLGLIPHKSMFSRVSKHDLQQINSAIEQVGLHHKVEQLFEHLSGGEKQRALIARAILQSPQLLIMDEPTSHLDVKYQIQIMELAKSLGITVIASFHDLNLASAMCDNLLVMKDGALVAQGKPIEVITSDMLSTVFGVCAEVSQHPQHHAPHITYFYNYPMQSAPSQGGGHV